MALTRVRWRLSLTLLCLFASTFQSSLAVTHVHADASGQPFVAARPASDSSDAHALALEARDSSTALASERSTNPAQKHAGGARESNACPLCQILMFGGGLPVAPFQMPARFFTAAVHLPLEQVPACFIAAVSYDWQSRGPPRI